MCIDDGALGNFPEDRELESSLIEAQEDKSERSKPALRNEFRCRRPDADISLPYLIALCMQRNAFAVQCLMKTTSIYMTV